jgi:hypothetical protein
MFVWCRFYNSCPECGQYEEKNLEWLVESLLDYDYDEYSIKNMTDKLHNLELGVLTKVCGYNIVKIWEQPDEKI